VWQFSQAVQTMSGEAALIWSALTLADFPAWVASTGQEILRTDQAAGEVRFYVKRLL
jgi:TusA-related sulfurtransferase